METADTREHYLVHWPAARPWTRKAIRARNPLLRVPTRRERIVTRLAFCGLLLLAVVMTLLCLLTFERGTAAERFQADSRHHVTATVEGAADPTMVTDRFLAETRLRVSYALDGTRHATAVDSTQAVSVGSLLPLWVDDVGRPTSAPQVRSGTIRDTALVGFLGLAILVVLLAGGRAAYDEWSVRQHLDDWDVDWVRFNFRHRNGPGSER